MLESFVPVKERNQRLYPFILSSPAHSLNPVYAVRHHRHSISLEVKMVSILSALYNKGGIFTKMACNSIQTTKILKVGSLRRDISKKAVQSQAKLLQIKAPLNSY